MKYSLSIMPHGWRGDPGPDWVVPVVYLKQQCRMIKDIVHKQTDWSRLLRPTAVAILPEIKNVSKMSMTLKSCH